MKTSRHFHRQTHFSFFEPTRSKVDRIRTNRLCRDWQGGCTVYLLHFHHDIGSDNVRGKARHYVGMVNSTDPDALRKRLYCHRKGYANGSKLTRAFFQEGIGFDVGHVWRGVIPHFEGLVKSIHNHRLCCELCQDMPFFDHLPLF